MNVPIFLTSVDAIPKKLESLPTMQESQSNFHAWEDYTYDGCTIALVGRKESGESVCALVTGFYPCLTFRLPLSTDDVTINDGHISNMLMDISGDTASCSIKYVRFDISKNFTTNGYHPHQDDPCRPQDYRFVSVYFHSLPDYQRLRVNARKRLHNKGQLYMGAIPVELDYGPEQQFMDAFDIPPSSWFTCTGDLVEGDLFRTTCDEEWNVDLMNGAHVIERVAQAVADSYIPPALTLLCYDIEVNSVSGKFPKASDRFCEIKTIACRVVRSSDPVDEPDCDMDGAARQEMVVFVYVENCELPNHYAGAHIVRCETEINLIYRFIDFITSSKCDVVVSYNGVGFDLPYIRQRVAYLSKWEFGLWSTRRHKKRMLRLNGAGRLPCVGRPPRVPTDYMKGRWGSRKTKDSEDSEEDSGQPPPKRARQTKLMFGNDTRETDEMGDGVETTKDDLDSPSFFQLLGVVDWDHFLYLSKGFKQYDDFKLDTVCREELDVGKLEEIKPDDIFRILTTPTTSEMLKLILYNLIDVTRPLQLLYKKSEVAFVQQLAFYTHTTVSDIVSRGQQHRLTQFFIKHAHGRNYRYEQMSRVEFCEKPWLFGPMEGATVLPTRKCHLRQDENGDLQYGITCDFNSLYPSIQRSRNLSPEMHLREDVDLVSASPAELQPWIYAVTMREDEPLVQYTHRVVQPDRKKGTNVGLMPEMLEYLLTARKGAKKGMKAYEKNSYDYKRMDIVQNVLKLICNSIYGSLGAIGQFGRLSNRVLARLVTYNGRHMINIASRAFLLHDKTCILAGDTDSVMALCKGLSLEQAVAHGHVVANQINAMLMEQGLVHSKIEFEKAMGNATFLAQKNYIYEKYEGYPEVGDETTMGLLNKKRGTAQIFKDTYSTIVRISLLDAETVSPDDMRALVLRVLRELFFTLERAPIQSFVKTQSLGAENSYKTPTAAVHAFRKLRAARGTPWPTGKQRVSIVTEFNPNPKSKVSENACILDHFLERHARGEAKLDLMTYLSNVSNRFISLLNQLGIAGDARMKECTAAYKQYAAGHCKTLGTLFSMLDRKSVSTNVSEEDALSNQRVTFTPMIVGSIHLPQHTDVDVWIHRKKGSRPPNYEEYSQMRRLEAQACLSVKDELLRVDDPNLQVVMDKLNPSKMTSADLKQQAECQRIFDSSLEVPNSADMSRLVKWARTGQSPNTLSKETIEDILLRLEATLFDTKRTTKNCWYDYPDDILDAVDRLRKSDVYIAKLTPLKSAALERLLERARCFSAVK